MDELQAASLPRIVQMYTSSSTSVSCSKVQSILISHCPHDAGKVTYQTLSAVRDASGAVLPPLMTPEALHGVTPVSAQVLQEGELGQLFPSLVLPPYKPMLLEAPHCAPHASVVTHASDVTHATDASLTPLVSHVTHASYVPYDIFIRNQGTCIVAKLPPQPVEEVTERKCLVAGRARPRGVTRDPSRWACNVRAARHQRGEGYVSRRGKRVPPRAVTNTKDCLTSCKYKCNARIDDTDRQLIFKAFYSLNANEKKHFILNTTERHRVKRGGGGAAAEGAGMRARRHAFKYAFVVRAVRHTVCKNFYLGTLAISQKPVYNVHAGKTDANVPKPDGRGRSAASNHGLPEHIKEAVCAHIETFSAADSKPLKRFSRKKQHLPPGVTVKQMYADYCAGLPSGAGAGLVLESMYRRIARKQYNVHARPQTVHRLCANCKEPVKLK